VPNNSPKKGQARQIYLDTEQEFLLDAIGVAMGQRRLGVKPRRSQLISTAVRNFIIDCEEEEDLREAIERARKALQGQADRVKEVKDDEDG